MSPAEQIRAKLAELGDTPESVAASLHAAGARGVRDQGDACPVYDYLATALADLAVVRVDTCVEWTERGALHTLLVPEPVADFIDQFDAGAYDELAVTS